MEDECLEATHLGYIGPDMPFHLATAFFAILAYPSQSSYNRRDDLVDALNAWRSKNAWKRKYVKREKISRKLMEIPNQQILGRINRASARILKRMEAADVLRHVILSEFSELSAEDGFAKRLTLSFPIKDGKLLFPLKKKRSSRTSIIEEYATSKGQDSSYFKQSMWSESVPVIHLASHFQDALTKFARKSVELNEQSLPIPWDLPLMLMAAEDWVHECVQRAEATRLLNSRLHGIELSKTIKLSFEKS